MSASDKIIIKNASFPSFVGILEHEKKERQDILIDLEIYTDTREAGISDNIEKATDYSAVHNDIKSIIHSRHFNLIESIAGEIGEMVLNKYHAEKVMVRVKKPGALKEAGVKYTAVEIVRERP